MFQTISCIALGATLLVGSTFAQQVSETIPVTSNDPVVQGFVADCYGSNFSTFALVGYVARVGTFNFGSGTIASKGFFTTDPLEYTALGFKFTLEPYLGWGLWIAGGDDLVFTLDY